jgi:aminomethyltransferase
MTMPHGGIVDDLLVYRVREGYFLVVNAANIEKDFSWLQSHLFGKVLLTNRSAETALLAIQGPNAQKVMAELTDFDLDSMSYYTSTVAKIADVELLFSRTGYTGEDGFEIYVPPEHSARLWNELIGAGKRLGMELIGLGARDTLRLEMKMALYGNDIDETTSPIEAGLSWIVDLDKDFIGKVVIAKQKTEKPQRRLVCLEMVGKAVPRKGYDLCDEGKVIGRVTSGTFSPSLREPIALGYVPSEKSKPGSEVSIDVRGTMYPAVVVKPPFYKKASHR